MYGALISQFPKLTLHCDLAADDWDFRRGLQDIVKK
jgi:ribosomal protein S15P/S13E